MTSKPLFIFCTAEYEDLLLQFRDSLIPKYRNTCTEIMELPNDNHYSYMYDYSEPMIFLRFMCDDSFKEFVKMSPTVKGFFQKNTKSIATYYDRPNILDPYNNTSALKEISTTMVERLAGYLIKKGHPDFGLELPDSIHLYFIR